MSVQPAPAEVITFTGTIYDADGSEREVKDMRLELIEREFADRSAGITSSAALCCPEGTPDDADFEQQGIGLSVDLGDWEAAACEQLRGGHNFEWRSAGEYEDVRYLEKVCTKCQTCRDTKEEPIP